MVSQVRFLEERVRGRGAHRRSCSWHRAALVLTIPARVAGDRAQIVAEVGDVSRFRSAAALVSYARA